MQMQIYLDGTAVQVQMEKNSYCSAPVGRDVTPYTVTVECRTMQCSTWNSKNVVFKRFDSTKVDNVLAKYSTLWLYGEKE